MFIHAGIGSRGRRARTGPRSFVRFSVRTSRADSARKCSSLLYTALCAYLLNGAWRGVVYQSPPRPRAVPHASNPRSEPSRAADADADGQVEAINISFSAGGYWTVTPHERRNTKGLTVFRPCQSVLGIRPPGLLAVSTPPKSNQDMNCYGAPQICYRVQI
jgi:hypothetical protein